MTIAATRPIRISALLLVALTLAAASPASDTVGSLSVAPAHMENGPLPADCRVQLLRDGSDEPAAYPCATHFRPPHGRYAVWIEARDLISREIVNVEHGAASGRQEILTSLIPAARVKIPAEGLDPQLRVVLLQLTQDEKPFRRELPVRVAAKDPVAVAAGRLLAVVFDSRREVLQISRPIVAPPRATVTADFDPGAKADLIALLDTPATPAEEPALLADERPANVLVKDGEELLAVWYGLEPGNARVTVRSERLFMEPRDTQLRAGSLSGVRAELRNRPALTIRVEASNEDAAGLAKARAMLRVRVESDERVLKETSLEDAMAHRFEFLPPEILEAAIEIGSWNIRKRIDLTSAMDTEVTFEVESLSVAGVVTYGGERAPARLQFRRDDEAIDVETDDDGRYQVRLWQPGRFIAEVWLRDRPGAPSHQDFVRIDESTTTRDFRIPRTHYRVSVVDADTGTPIARAMVTSFNTWIDPKEGRRRAGRPVFADAKGVAELPPMRPGEIEVHAAAPGYSGGEPQRFVVPEGDTAEDRPALLFRLKSMGKGQRARVLLPNGAPASGARLLACTDAPPARVLWQGLASAGGEVEIPEIVDGAVLLVRHPAAGSLVRRWSRSQAEPLALPAAAAPVVAKVLRADEKPARFVEITAWINGVALGSTALSFLTDQPPSTDRDGVWTARNLPAAPIRLLATARAPQDPRAVEALAKSVEHPWPASVVLRVIE